MLTNSSSYASEGNGAQRGLRRGIGAAPESMPAWKEQSLGRNIRYGKVSRGSLREQRESLPIFKLKKELFSQLSKQGDPRMFGKGDVFDNYPYSGKSTDNFFQRYQSGEKVRAGWVSSSDFEKDTLD